MKAIILAAGRGSRMKELVKDIPKPLIDVNGKPFVEHLIEELLNSGINKIGVVVGYNKEKIINFLEKKYFGKITIFVQDLNEYGTGKALLSCKNFIEDGEEFLVVNGDDLHSKKDYAKFLIEENKNFSLIGGFKSTSPENFGQLIENNDFLEKICEKQNPPISNLVNSGVYKLNSKVFEILRKLTKSKRGEYELTDAISTLALKKEVKIVHLKKIWFSLTTVKDLEKIKRRTVNMVQ